MEIEGCKRHQMMNCHHRERLVAAVEEYPTLALQILITQRRERQKNMRRRFGEN